MANKCEEALVDVEKVRKWLFSINSLFIAVRPPRVFINMGFPAELVKKCVRQHRRLRLNDGTMGKGIGVSDTAMLAHLAEALEVNTFEIRRLESITNLIGALRDACIARLDEIVE